MFQERMSHAGTGSVCERQKPARVFRADQDCGDFARACDVELQLFRCGHFDAILAELDRTWLTRRSGFNVKPDGQLKLAAPKSKGDAARSGCVAKRDRHGSPQLW